MELNFHKYPSDEYKKIRLEKQKLVIDGKPFADFFAIKKNMDILPGSDKRYPKTYLLSNMNTLNDHMRLELTLKEVKKKAELLSNSENEYKTTMYILFYKKLKTFYILLTVFILQLTHIFYWDEFEFINNLMRSQKSGIDLQRSLKMAMKIGADIKKSFERVMFEEFKTDPLLNDMFKEGIFAETQNELKLNLYEQQFDTEDIKNKKVKRKQKQIDIKKKQQEQLENLQQEKGTSNTLQQYMSKSGRKNMTPAQKKTAQLKIKKQEAEQQEQQEQKNLLDFE